MPTATSPSFLHRVLVLDAALCLAAGLALLAGAGLAAGLLGLPAGLLRGAGLALLPVAGCIAWLVRQPTPPRPAVQALVILNLAWVAGSLMLLLGGWVSPTLLGTAFILVQAAMVAGFAALEAKALRDVVQPAPISGQAGRA
jgi:hypothetical protein